MAAPRTSTTQVSLPPTQSALAAPFIVVAQDLRRIVEQPGPFLGGLLGTIVSCSALVAALLWLPSPAAAEPESPLVIEFIPASAMSLGELEGETGAATSEPQTEPTPPAPTPPTPKPHDPKPNPSPSPNPNPGSNPDPGGASPFGDPDAWGDMVRDGDPWAGAVMRALRSMKVPAWAGKIATERPFEFRLIICKDGRIDQVLRKQSTGDADLDATLVHEISRLVLPPVPASMAASMSRSCVTLSYSFTWSATGVR